MQILPMQILSMGFFEFHMTVLSALWNTDALSARLKRGPTHHVRARDPLLLLALEVKISLHGRREVELIHHHDLRFGSSAIESDFFCCLV